MRRLNPRPGKNRGLDFTTKTTEDDSEIVDEQVEADTENGPEGEREAVAGEDAA